MKHLVKLSFVVTNELPDDWTGDEIRFRLEESYCSSNYMKDLVTMAEYEDKHSVCNTCAFSETKWLGEDKGQEEIENIRILRDEDIKKWITLEDGE